MRARILLVAAVAAAMASGAGAAGEPAAYADARDGSFVVTSGVVLLAKAAEMKGVWLDETKPCSTTRKLRVSIEVGYVPPAGQGRRVRLSRSGMVENCAEGGPNFGYLVQARRLNFACPSGTWKPGRYSFLTRTLDTASGLAASASLLWDKRSAC